MSFSRAKRFVYKSSDVDCSPADYLFSWEVQNGCSMPKSGRFENPKKPDEGSIVCSRMYRSLGPEKNTVESNGRRKSAKSATNKTCVEFTGSATFRKYIKACRKNNKTETTKTGTNKTCNQVLNMKVSVQEYTNDYRSTTSSEDSQKNTDDFEMDQIYNALKRLQLKRNRSPPKPRSSSFEETVLKKLDSIERDVKIIKEDVTYMPSNTPNPFLRRLNAGDTNYAVAYQPPNQELIKSIIRKAIQNLGQNIESKTRSWKKISEEHILNMIAAMYASSDKSNREINEICNTTTEDIVEKLSRALQCSTLNSECDIEDSFDELRNQYFTDKILQSSNLHSIVTDYLEQTREVGEELEEDFSDITLKCMGTEQMLNVQGAILDEMKNEIRNLKSNTL